eukprot:3655505-Alexandrium_andersonii.AAC.1
MRQGVNQLHQERLQQLVSARLLRRLPADGLQQPEGALQALPQHGEDQELLPTLRGAQGARGLHGHRGPR